MENVSEKLGHIKIYLRDSYANNRNVRMREMRRYKEKNY